MIKSLFKKLNGWYFLARWKIAFFICKEAKCELEKMDKIIIEYHNYMKFIENNARANNLDFGKLAESINFFQSVVFLDDFSEYENKDK